MASRLKLRLWFLASPLLAAALVGTALAEVRVEVATTIPDAQGNVTVEVILHTGGDSVGGFQNDIVFDHTVVRLDDASSCRINPAIGTTPFGSGPDVVTCGDDASIGPCKTLSRGLATCAGDPPPDGCPAEAPDYSRLRAIVAGTEVFNQIAIADGSVAYTCTFTVVDGAALPVRLFNTNVVVSDPRGSRLSGSGEDGGVCVDDADSQRCAALRPIDVGCTIDLECESGNCDRCCDHQFNGICAPPRTATPTDAPTATRTPSVTRTVTSTRTASATRPPTSTPVPAPPGGHCDSFSVCGPGFACNYEEGFICCTSDPCPDGMSCSVGGLEGYCIRPYVEPPPPDAVVIRFDREPTNAEGISKVTASLHSNGTSVGGMQNDIVFDNTVLGLDPNDCRINAAIGLFPLGEDGPTCLDDASIGPCKNLAKAVNQCGLEPDTGACPQGAAPNISAFRGIIAATAAPNENPIPDGPLYTCSFRIIDPTQPSFAFWYANIVVSDPQGGRLPVVMQEYPLAAAARCSAGEECESGFCVDGVCCAEGACSSGRSCAISAEEGTCRDKHAAGDDCNLGSDCQSGNCDLVGESPSSDFRGACGPPRAPTVHAGECDDGDECESGNCVDGFCCVAVSCPAGQFCNTGECAPPAEPGAPCTTDEQCALGLCVDGACCVTGACGDGLSCNVPTRAGVCREPFRLGSECDLDEQCPTGFCTDGACCESDSCPTGMRCDVGSDAGRCVSPPTPGGEDSSGGVPTASHTPQFTHTIPPGAEPTRPASTPTPDPFGPIEDSGCSIAPRTSGLGLLWPLAAVGVLVGLRAAGQRRKSGFIGLEGPARP